MLSVGLVDHTKVAKLSWGVVVPPVFPALFIWATVALYVSWQQKRACFICLRKEEK
jgi:hypothetical protein